MQPGARLYGEKGNQQGIMRKVSTVNEAYTVDTREDGEVGDGSDDECVP
jgi:hypothetical protein